MERDNLGTMLGSEKEINFEDLDPNVALRMGVRANILSYEREESHNN